MSYHRTRAQSMDSPTPEQSRTIQDLTALVREQSSQIQYLIDLQNSHNILPGLASLPRRPLTSDF